MSDRKTVLFLDDESQYIEAIDDFLKGFGFGVEVASTPAQALQLLPEHKPDIVFFDFKMPDMEGDAFFKKAKALHPDAKYFLVTAYRNEATVEYFKGLGVQGVLMKPVNLQDVLQILRQ